MSFQEYLAKRRVGPNVAGDFVRDARLDHSMPDVATWKELNDYLSNLGACDGAIMGARIVWAGYLAKIRREMQKA